MREKLPARRACVTIKFKHSVGVASHNYLLSIGFHPDGRLGELFISTDGRAGSESDVNASDAAVAVSLALQYGCPLEELCQSMKRNSDGSPTGPLGKALEVARAFLDDQK